MKKVYRVILKSSASKDLESIPADFFLNIDKAISELGKNPRPFGTKKLDGLLYRVRVRRWRILYAIFDKEEQVIILRVRPRNEKTYKFLT